MVLSIASYLSYARHTKSESIVTVRQIGERPGARSDLFERAAFFSALDLGTPPPFLSFAWVVSAAFGFSASSSLLSYDLPIRPGGGNLKEGSDPDRDRSSGLLALRP